VKNAQLLFGLEININLDEIDDINYIHKYQKYYDIFYNLKFNPTKYLSKTNIFSIDFTVLRGKNMGGKDEILFENLKNEVEKEKKYLLSIQKPKEIIVKIYENRGSDKDKKPMKVFIFPKDHEMLDIKDSKFIDNDEYFDTETTLTNSNMVVKKENLKIKDLKNINIHDIERGNLTKKCIAPVDVELKEIQIN
jgi:hypothetical protein